jgi:hypothetical protein
MHDHLTGASFEISAAGVQSDWIISNDTNEDDSWDAVWECAVSIDKDGWSIQVDQAGEETGAKPGGYSVSASRTSFWNLSVKSGAKLEM